MSLVFIDSFDHYNTLAQMAQKWAVVDGAIISPGRFGGNCWDGGGVIATGIVKPTNASMGMGVAFKTEALGKLTTFVMAEAFVSNRVYVGTISDGRVQIGYETLPFPAVAARSTRSFVRANIWNYWEITYSSGSVSVYIDGALAVTGSIPDVDYGSGPVPPNVNTVTFQGPGGGFFAAFDDFWIDSSPVRHGDVNARANLPDGDGVALQWIPSSGTTHYNLVNQVPFVALDFVSTAVTARDSYTYGDIDTSRLITALQWVPYSGGISVTAETYIGGSFYNLGSTAQMAGGTGGFTNKIVTTNPATATDWTPSDFSAAQCGFFKII